MVAMQVVERIFHGGRILTWKDWVPTFTRTLRSWRVSSRPVEKAEVLACIWALHDFKHMWP